MARVLNFLIASERECEATQLYSSQGGSIYTRADTLESQRILRENRIVASMARAGVARSVGAAAGLGKA